MDCYANFARAYDMFMEDVPYDAWHDFIEKIFLQSDIKIKTVLDLAAGTGEMSIRLSNDGYDVIGIDISPDMLAIASEKAKKHHKDILFLCQPMEKMELYGTVDAIVCLCDSINYLLFDDDVLRTLKLSNNYLNPGGLLIFDINTKYKYEMIGEAVVAQNYEDGSFIWENSYDYDEKINQYDINFYLKLENGYYERFEETHFQKAYDIDETKEMIIKSGLMLVDIVDATTFNKPTEKSEKVFFICKEVSKI